MTNQNLAVPIASAGIALPTSAILLAAGASRRFGGIKLVQPLLGKPLLWHALDALAAVPLERRFLVVGAHAEAVLVCHRDWSADRHVNFNLPPGGAFEIVPNEQWEQGIASSIRAGVSAAPMDHWLLIALADQPLVQAEHFRALRAAREPQGAQHAVPSVIATAYKDIAGVPALFSPNLRKDLMSVQGDEGARKIILRQLGFQAGVRAVSSPDAAVDIDIPADLADARQPRPDVRCAQVSR